MTDWTPGPLKPLSRWSVASSDPWPIKCEWRDDQGRKCTAFVAGVYPNEHWDQETLIDLFAAAPDLYEALRYARRFLKPEDHDTAFVDAAPAKARGETQ